MIDTEISLHEVAERLGVHYMTAYRWVRQGMLPARKQGRSWLVRADDLASFESSRRDEPAPNPPRRDAPWAERLEARLVAGDERGSAEVMESVLAAGHDLTFLYLGVLAPAMAAIGARWEAGELEIYVEHRATGIALRLMAQIGPRFVRRGRSKGTVLMGAPEGEEHGVIVAMVADLVRERGWTVHDVGADLPAAALAEAVRGTDDLVAVCIGVTVAQSLRHARESIAAVKAVSDVPVFAGGAAVRDEAHARDLGADHRSGSVDELLGMLDSVARRN